MTGREGLDVSKRSLVMKEAFTVGKELLIAQELIDEHVAHLVEPIAIENTLGHESDFGNGLARFDKKRLGLQPNRFKA